MSSYIPSMEYCGREFSAEKDELRPPSGCCVGTARTRRRTPALLLQQSDEF